MFDAVGVEFTNSDQRWVLGIWLPLSVRFQLRLRDLRTLKG
jgi:hypothetical protein